MIFSGCYRRIVATQVRRARQIVDLTLGGNAGAAYVSDRNAREFKLVLFLVFAVIKRAVTPGVSNADGDRAAAEPHVGRRNRSRYVRGRRGSSICSRRCGGHDDGSKETQQ